MTAGSAPAAPGHPPRRVSVYIDGFNLYYGSLKGTPYKWLNPYALACALMPFDQVNAVHYFTARVKPTPKNPSVHQRQGIYLRALATLTNVHAREGFFLLKKSRQAKVQPLNPTNPKLPNPTNGTVEIWLNEEKGSDVNLATQLLLDAFDNNFEFAVVISNDSDLAWPIQMVRRKFKKNVGRGASISCSPATRIAGSATCAGPSSSLRTSSTPTAWPWSCATARS